MSESNMKRCSGSIFGRHRFEPRYDERPNEPVSTLFTGIESTSARTAREMIYSNTIRVYVCDVCIRCGEVSKERVPA